MIFISVTKKDEKVQIKLKDILNNYSGYIPYIYQSKIGYGTLLHNVILKEMINLMGTAIVDIYKEIKM